MAGSYSGDTTFEIESKQRGFRYELCVADEGALTLWLEDRVSKKQWTTEGLTTEALLTNTNAIPLATMADYAERFHECLDADATETRRQMKTKGTKRVVEFAVPLTWSGFSAVMHYALPLVEIPLERVDVLASRLRDVEDALRATGVTCLESPDTHDQGPDQKPLDQHVTLAAKRVDKEAVVGQAVTVEQCPPQGRLVWYAESGAYNTIVFTVDGRIRFPSAGIYVLTFVLQHRTTTSSASAFEIVQGSRALAVCSEANDDGAVMATTFQTIVNVQKDDCVAVVYTGDMTAMPGSRVTMFKL